MLQEGKGFVLCRYSVAVLLLCMMKDSLGICTEDSRSTVCPTRYGTRHFFNNFTTNENIATKFEEDLPHCVRNLTTS